MKLDWRGTRRRMRGVQLLRGLRRLGRGRLRIWHCGTLGTGHGEIRSYALRIAGEQKLELTFESVKFAVHVIDEQRDRCLMRAERSHRLIARLARFICVVGDLRQLRNPCRRQRLRGVATEFNKPVTRRVNLALNANVCTAEGAAFAKKRVYGD